MTIEFTSDTYGTKKSVSTSLVAKCLWQCQFDNKEEAYQLQEWFSHWSNVALAQIIESVVERVCPQHQTLRIDNLELDLGEIPYDELEHRVPALLEDALSQQLSMQFMHKLRSTKDSISNSVFETRHNNEAYLSWYLLHGTQPWWFRGQHTSLEIFQQFASKQRQQAAYLIRQLAKKQEVRQRIVWQWQVTGTKSVVKTLEPYHYEYIAHFTHQLAHYKEQEATLATKDNTEFSQYSWLWVLTHLVSERGSIFNAAAFVRSTIKQMAHHFQLNETLLFQQILLAFSHTNLQHDAPEIFKALQLLQQQELSKQSKDLEKAKQSIDEPQLVWLQEWLQSRSKSNAMLSGWLPGDLFLHFISVNPGDLKKLIINIGTHEAVRKQLVTDLRDEELQSLVMLLVPNEHSFIVDVVNHTANNRNVYASSQPHSRQMLWDVILAYLLVEKGSYFNRKQFVKHTLIQFAKRTGSDYRLLLEDMLKVDIARSHHASRFELLSILTELRTQIWKQHFNQIKASSDVCRPLRDFLLSEALPDQTTKESIRGLLQQMALAQPTVLKDIIHHCMVQGPSSISWSREITQRLISVTRADQLESLMAVFSTGQTRQLQLLSSSLYSALKWHSELRSLHATQTHLAVFTDLPKYSVQITQWQLQHCLFAAVLHSWHTTTVDFPDAVIISMRHSLGSDANAILQIWLGYLVLDSAGQLQKNADMTRLNSVNSESVTGGLSHKVSCKAEFHSLVTAIQSALGLSQTSSRPSLNSAEKEIAYLTKKINAASRPFYLAQLLRLYLLPDRFKQLSWDQKRQVSGLFQRLCGNDTKSWFTWLYQQSQQSQIIQVLKDDCDGELTAKLADTVIKSYFASAGVTSVHRLTSECVMSISTSELWRGSQTSLKQKLQRVICAWALDTGVNSIYSGTTALQNLVIAVASMLRVAPSKLFLTLSKSQTLAQSDITRLAGTMASSLTNELTPFATHESERQNKNQVQNQDNSLIKSCLMHLLLNGHLPGWAEQQHFDVAKAIKMMLSKPTLFREVFLKVSSSPQGIERFAMLVEVQELSECLQQHFSAAIHGAKSVSQLYLILNRIKFATSPPINIAEHKLSVNWLNTVTIKLLLQYWLQPDWSRTVAKQFLAEVEHYLALQPGDVTSVLSSFRIEIARLAETQTPAIQAIVKDFLNTQHTVEKAQGAEPSRVKSVALETFNQDNTCMEKSISVNNAGMVLAQSFVPMLFSRLQLIANDDFTNPTAQRQAVHHLQFLASGRANTEEPFLVLNKILCGLALHTPVEAGIDIDSEQISLHESLLETMVGYWPAIGHSSIEGFRGNWLIRDGVLTESKDQWDLVIEKRPYDLLLERAPFSYSIVNFHWMPKPLYVTWPT